MAGSARSGRAPGSSAARSCCETATDAGRSQLAAVVDDMRHGIDLVVRGDDLLASTGRRILLGRWLGRAAPAVFVHHGLIRHPHGDKLSKSNRDTGVRDLRRAGWTSERVIGHAAWRVGLTAREGPLSADEAAALVPAPAA